MSPAVDSFTPSVDALRQDFVARLSGAGEANAGLQPQTPSVPVEVPATPSAAPAGQEPTEPITAAEPVVEEAFELKFDDDEKPAAVEPQPEAQPAAEQGNSKEREEIYKTLQSSPIGRNFIEANREMAKLADPPEKGGIGFRPKAEQIKEWRSSYSKMDSILLDYSSGDPNGIANVVNFFFGKVDGNLLPGADKFIEHFPKALYEENREAYVSLGRHFGSQMAQVLSRRAEGADEASKARLQDAALILGHVFNLNQSAAPAAAEGGEQSEIERLQARLRQLEGRDAEASQSTIRSNIESSINSAIKSDAEQILAPLKASYADQPAVFNALVADVERRLRETVGSNREVAAEVERLKIHALRGNRVDPAQIARMFRTGYRDHWQTIRKEYVKATGAVVAQANEQRSVLQNAQTHTAPRPGAAPATSTPTPTRNPGESFEDYAKRAMRARLGVA